MMYDALIIVNGEIAQSAIWRHIVYKNLICTDGAALQLLKLGLVPNLILGDMDSLADLKPSTDLAFLQNAFPQTHILPIHDQDTTDFEKALQYAQDQQYQRVLCLGAMGKAADHSLYNLSLLTRYSEKFELIFLHQVDNKTQWIFTLKPYQRLQAEQGSVISFWPMPEACVSTHGLKWELQSKNLSQTQSSSIRNRTVTELIDIECDGPCLCFLTALDAAVKPRFDEV